MTIIMIFYNTFMLFSATIKLGVYGALYGLLVGWELLKGEVTKVIEKLKKSKKSGSEVTWIQAD